MIIKPSAASTAEEESIEWSRMGILTVHGLCAMHEKAGAPAAPTVKRLQLDDSRQQAQCLHEAHIVCQKNIHERHCSPHVERRPRCTGEL
jgi:hypothetical protein